MQSSGDSLMLSKDRGKVPQRGRGRKWSGSALQGPRTYEVACCMMLSPCIIQRCSARCCLDALRCCARDVRLFLLLHHKTTPKKSLIKVRITGAKIDDLKSGISLPGRHKKSGQPFSSAFLRARTDSSAAPCSAGS
jgi:hypothetical protein